MSDNLAHKLNNGELMRNYQISNGSVEFNEKNSKKIKSIDQEIDNYLNKLLTAVNNNKPASEIKENFEKMAITMGKRLSIEFEEIDKKINNASSEEDKNTLNKKKETRIEDFKTTIGEIGAILKDY